MKCVDIFACSKELDLHFLMEYSDIAPSAVRIFEILNWIEQLLQYLIRNEHNYSKLTISNFLLI